MNPIKLTSADFVLGKTLIMIKTVLDLVVLISKKPSVASLNQARLILKVKPTFTMVKSRNLVNLFCLVEKVNAMNIPGDIVECGVWNGGASAIMAYACFKTQIPRNRLLWLFDSFEGLPPPGPMDGRVEKAHFFKGMCTGSVSSVAKVFQKLCLSMDHVRIVKGWFEATLKKAAVHQIAVLHIDADWYESVKCVLETLYEKVVPGGFVVLDDYGYWGGCDRALEDFISQRNLTGIVLQKVESTGVFFQKPHEM
jgi:O-methyltransferase